jgi:uncharacterized membrane protein YkoI
MYQNRSEKLTVKRKLSNPKSILKMLAVLLGVLHFSLAVVAQDIDTSNDRNDPRNTPRNVLPDNGVNSLTSPRISRRQASSIASSRYEGRVLSIMLDNNTNDWRVRMDRDGTVFNVFVNASSGDVKASSD